MNRIFHDWECSRRTGGECNCGPGKGEKATRAQIIPSKQIAQRGPVAVMSERSLEIWKEAKDRERGNFAEKTAAHAPFDRSQEKGEPIDEEGNTIGQPGPSDIAELDFLCPTWDDQLNRRGSSLTGFSIMEDIFAVVNGIQHIFELRLFIEGKPIGAYVKREPSAPGASITPAWNFRQEAMHKLRDRNNKVLARHLTKVMIQS